MLEYAIPIAVAFVLAIALAVYLFSRRRPDDSTQRHDSATTPDDIQHVIQQLLDATPAGETGGFVIFSGSRDLDYVQFAVDPNGLLLNWPTIQKDGPERLPKFREQLKRRGFQEISPTDFGPPISEQIANLKTGQLMILDDGLYAQTGRDASKSRDLTIALLRDIFGLTDLNRVDITLEPDG